MTMPSRIACLAAASLAALVAAASARAEEKVAIQLPWILNVQHSSYVMARDKGFYKEVGLDVEIRPGGVQINPNPLVASGQVTFGMNDAPNLINSRAQGMPLIAVAACWQIHPGGLYALEKTGVRQPKDLEGKSLAYDIGGPWTLVQAMLVKSGVDLSKVRLINTAGNEVLMKGTVDARTGFVINGPVTIKLAGMETTSLRAGDYGVPAYADVVFVSEETAKTKPELVKKFVAATIKGLKYAYDHPEETVKAVTTANDKLNPAAETIQFGLQRSLIFTPGAEKTGLCHMDAATFEATYQVMKTYGGLKTDVDVSKMFTTDFLPKP